MKRNRKNLMILSIACIVAIALAAGCASKAPRTLQPSEMPEWCMKQSGVEQDAKRGKLIVGVGAVSGIKSPAMARTNADGQARAEIAKQFSSFTENLLKQYQRHTSADGKATEEQDFMQATRIFSKMNVRGAAIEDRYVDETNNTWYSKAVIPVDQLKQMIQDNNELDARVREFVRDNSDQAFQELDAMSDKPAE